MRSQDRIDDDSIKNVPGRRQRNEDRHGQAMSHRATKALGHDLAWPGRCGYVVVSLFGGLVVLSLFLVGDEMSRKENGSVGVAKGNNG